MGFVHSGPPVPGHWAFVPTTFQISCASGAFGVAGLLSGGIEALALYGARKYQKPTTDTEKLIKYSLVAIAAIAALSASLAGAIGVGLACIALNTPVAVCHVAFIGTILLSLAAHQRAFRGL